MYMPSKMFKSFNTLYHLVSLMLKFRRLWMCGCEDVYFSIIFCMFVETMYVPEFDAVSRIQM